MLRNMVTSLFQHETIKTTLPKAEETARMAEKMITLSKNRDAHAWRTASGYVLDPAALDKLFGTFAARYASRPGGYTRIHKFGHRQGDNAPVAVLELVDNPRDIKMEVTARAVGWELLKARLRTGSIPDILQHGVKGADDFIRGEMKLGKDSVGELRPATRFNLKKILKYGRPTIVSELATKAEEHIGQLLAQPVHMRALLDKMEQEAKKNPTPQSLADFEMKRASFYRGRTRAGQALPGETLSAIRLSKGALARPKKNITRKRPVEKSKKLSFATVYGDKPTPASAEL
ncbi:hypothetical protein HWV62_37561 [Athelia sp. TMB]|nr:hypothetical protein HWV62_37561 [Athelia sp. TMB]